MIKSRPTICRNPGISQNDHFIHPVRETGVPGSFVGDQKNVHNPLTFVKMHRFEESDTFSVYVKEIIFR
jgi:hypothetical protein